MIKSEILYAYALSETWSSEMWLLKKVLSEKSRGTLFWGPIFTVYNIKPVLKNDHLSITTTNPEGGRCIQVWLYL